MWSDRGVQHRGTGKGSPAREGHSLRGCHPQGDRHPRPWRKCLLWGGALWGTRPSWRPFQGSAPDLQNPQPGVGPPACLLVASAWGELVDSLFLLKEELQAAAAVSEACLREDRGRRVAGWLCWSRTKSEPRDPHDQPGFVCLISAEVSLPAEGRGPSWASKGREVPRAPAACGLHGQRAELLCERFCRLSCSTPSSHKH